MFKTATALVLLGVNGLAQSHTGQGKPHIIETPPSLKLIKTVQPKIPSGVKSTHLYQPVTIKLVVDKKGLPEAIKVTKGDPVLADAVVDAVRQWRWKPLQLNGVSVEVETTITVNFEPGRDP